MEPVLVVDDELVMRTFLSKALRKLGYQVTLAETAEEALRCFAPRSFSLVLTDLRMPGISGLELLDQIQRLDPKTPVVIMTAFGSITTAVEAVQRGAADFVTKPIQLEHLGLVLKRTLKVQETTDELERLRPHADERESLGGMIGRSLPMKKVYSLVDKVAGSDLTVLILGDAGTGKELCARAIHDRSKRAKHRFQVVNCSALQESLVESELFGHERGAFTGAAKRRIGHFEVAVGGTLFLDEVGEASPSLQAKLLRAIQQKEITRVGGTDSISVDVRIVAATNRNLEADARSGRFREDLYYRLAPFPIKLAPLRERSGDITLLTEHFLEQQKSKATFDVAANLALESFDWPGNVRQLENAISRAAILADNNQITLEHLAPEVLAATSSAEADDAVDVHLFEAPLRQAREGFERLYLERLLQKCGGNVSESARQAGMGRASLHEKINKLSLDPQKYR